MKTRREFTVSRSRDEVVEALACDDAVLDLLPGGTTELVDKQGDRRTTCTHYTALGRDGTATFHFDTLLDGNLRFEKVCDGRVWQELRGEVVVEEEGDGARIEIEMHGRTKTLVPEFAIKGPMEEQIDEMTRALADYLDR